jgi:hypothetical protein
MQHDRDRDQNQPEGTPSVDEHGNAFLIRRRGSRRYFTLNWIIMAWSSCMTLWQCIT